MSAYRIPSMMRSVSVNGTTYAADSNGLFWPANAADAEEMEKLGGYQDAYPGAWDDLRFPAQAINPAGAVAAPGVDTTLTAFPGTLLFSGAQDNIVCGVAQMPHAWERGSAIRPHIHWSKTVGSTDAVTWQLYYRHVGSPGEAPGAWVGPVAGTIVAGSQANTDEHLLTSFGEIDMNGRKESSIIAWQIRRLGATDADGNFARLYEFDIHFRASKMGTDVEMPAT